MEQNANTIIVNKIRDGYMEKTPTKVDELVKLDRQVKRPAKAIAYTLGVVGSLVLGGGMCLAMGVVGKKTLPGVIIGTAGIAMLAGNYPLYKANLKARKAEYAPRILQLAEELQSNP